METLEPDRKNYVQPLVAFLALAGIGIAAYTLIRRRRDVLPAVNDLLDACEDAVQELELRLSPHINAKAG
jgi:hypothetical protein